MATRNQALFDWLYREARGDASPPVVDLHMHTTWTDGADSAEAMWRAACAAQLRLILFSEHARRSSTDWFPRFAEEVRALPKEPCAALVGVEAKIADFDGNLDLAPEIENTCDLVMASVHRFPGEEGQIMGTTGGYGIAEASEIEFRLAMAALDNPSVDILGHPFGMTVRRFGGTLPWNRLEELIAKAAATGKAIEINARYHEEPRRMLNACLLAGARVSFGSNAHAVAEVGALQRHPDWRGAA